MSAFEFPRSFDPPDTPQGTIDPSLLPNHTAVSPGGSVPASSSHAENDVFQLSPSGGGDEDLPESTLMRTRAHSQSPQHPNNHGHGNDEVAHEPGTNDTASGTSHTTTASLTEELGLSHPFLSECGLEFDSPLDHFLHKITPHAEGHCIADRRLFKCNCGQKFARLFTLERHIVSFHDSMPEYHCDECNNPDEEKSFSRKDHLVQHLRVYHKYEPAQLEARFPPRKSRVLAVSVCHIKSCEYYRDDGFQDVSWQEKERTRPFAKQSDYTAHMKKEHDWSPYPCDFPGCKKVDGKGFFSLTALSKHRDEQHPGMAPLELAPRIVRKVKCGHCHKSLKPISLQYHKCEMRK
ncbi:hypothetical protein F5X96DRAFT_675204 [Biscogniauxia mediterranea]|nr:hypothetical protein F5X96DRAFT_675204 [Biscogniauxia mediterranea]